jgi:predicted nucleotidyltransferase
MSTPGEIVGKMAHVLGLSGTDEIIVDGEFVKLDYLAEVPDVFIIRYVFGRIVSLEIHVKSKIRRVHDMIIIHLEGCTGVSVYVTHDDNSSDTLQLEELTRYIKSNQIDIFNNISLTYKLIDVVTQSIEGIIDIQHNAVKRFVSFTKSANSRQ